MSIFILFIISFIFIKPTQSSDCFTVEPYCTLSFKKYHWVDIDVEFDPDTFLYILTNYKLKVQINDKNIQQYPYKSRYSTQFIIITPDMGEDCGNNKCLTMRLQSKSDKHIILTKQIMLILKEGVIDQTITKIGKKTYGFYVKTKDLPVLVSLVPNPYDARADTDLFAYTSDKPTMAFFPTVRNKNHMHNTREAILINRDKNNYFRKNAFYIIEVVAPDANIQKITYKLGMKKNCNFLCAHFFLSNLVGDI